MWDKSISSSVDGYIVYYGTYPGSYTKSLDIGNSTTCVLANLVPGQTYFFAVTAYYGDNNNFLESNPSEELRFKVPLATKPAGEIILDNGDAGTSATGIWSVSSGPDYYGFESLYSRQAGATYTYRTAINGNCEISLWWTQLPSRDTRMPVKVYNGNTLIDTVWINQQKNGGQWYYLGTYDFGGDAKVVITSETKYNSTCADAVRFEPLSTPPLSIEVIIDNGAAGTSATGSWSLSTGPHYYGEESLYSRTAGATYTYQTAINGNSDIFLWWTQLPSRDTSVPVNIYDGNMLIDVVWINQQENGGQWNYIGTYNFAGTAKVGITSETNRYSTCVDAVMFSP